MSDWQGPRPQSGDARGGAAACHGVRAAPWRSGAQTTRVRVVGLRAAGRVAHLCRSSGDTSNATAIATSAAAGASIAAAPSLVRGIAGPPDRLDAQLGWELSDERCHNDASRSVYSLRTSDVHGCRLAVAFMHRLGPQSHHKRHDGGGFDRAVAGCCAADVPGLDLDLFSGGGWPPVAGS